MITERFKCKVATHLFLIKTSKILLLERKNTGFCDGMFSVVAGHIDGDETLIEATVREAKEEVGILVKKSDLYFIQVMHRKKESEERIDFFFECKKWQGEVRLAEPIKCSRLKWVSLEKLPTKTVPYVAFAIGQYLGGKKFTLFGWN